MLLMMMMQTHVLSLYYHLADTAAVMVTAMLLLLLLLLLLQMHRATGGQPASIIGMGANRQAQMMPAHGKNAGKHKRCPLTVI